MCLYSGLGKTCDAFPDTIFGGCKGLDKTKYAEMELPQEIFEFSGECFVPIGEVPFMKQIHSSRKLCWIYVSWSKSRSAIEWFHMAHQLWLFLKQENLL